MTMNENIIEKKTHLSANVSFIHVIKHELLLNNVKCTNMTAQMIVLYRSIATTTRSQKCRCCLNIVSANQIAENLSHRWRSYGPRSKLPTNNAIRALGIFWR